jgi:hypothetical protein
MQSREICAVRLTVLPDEFTSAGLMVYAGLSPVYRPWHKTELVMAGVIRGGDDNYQVLVVSVVRRLLDRQPSAELMQRVYDWADGWITDKENRAAVVTRSF